MKVTLRMTTEIKKINTLYDESTQAYVDVYSAPGVEGKLVAVEVPREDQEAEVVARHLHRRGAVLGTREERREPLATAIKSDAPLLRRVACTGWHGRRAFVTHRHVASRAKDGPPLVPPKLDTGWIAGQIDVVGSLDGWRELVGVSAHSTALTVSLCVSFGAPLLHLLHRPSFGVALVGPSRCGKSFAQLVGASVIGFGTEVDLPNLNGTPAGLLAAAMAFNDHAFFLNEIGTVQGRKREVYVSLRDRTYALMDGTDVIRHPSWNAGQGGRNSFLVILLLSSEHSPDAWAARSGETRDEGETARLIGIPALYDGRATIFDRAPKDLDGVDLDRWVRKQYARLRADLPKHRGVAFNAYADHIVRRRKKVMGRARHLVARFEKALTQAGISPVARDIIAKFGVLYAGGVIAAEAGILPLDEAQVKRALRRACRAAIDELPDRRLELNTDLAMLRGRLQGAPIVDLDACTRKEMKQIRQADGFRQQEGTAHEFAIRAKVFEGWFSDGPRVRQLLERLDEEGFLRHQPRTKAKRSNDWAQKQITWPDGTRVRSYVLFLPNGPADLTELT